MLKQVAKTEKLHVILQILKNAKFWSMESTWNLLIIGLRLTRFKFDRKQWILCLDLPLDTI